jgi:glycosyltransferase involved in cell wall biosynthesis
VLSPGSPLQRTGGYRYNAEVVAVWRSTGRDVVVHALEGDWPAGPLRTAFPEVGEGDRILADGLCWTGLGPAREALAARTTVLVHLALDGALRAAEQRALEGVHAVVATGRPTLEALDRDDVVSVPPGQASVGRTSGPAASLLTVGTLTPRKGLLDLVDVLDRVQGPWTWTVVGGDQWDPVHAAEVRAAVARRPWADRVHFVGELDPGALDGVYRTCGTLLHGAHVEPFGMVLQEAAAHGLRIVSRPAGALETLGPAGVWTWRTVGDGAAAVQQALAADHGVPEGTFPTWDSVADRIWEVMHG